MKTGVVLTVLLLGAALFWLGVRTGRHSDRVLPTPVTDTVLRVDTLRDTLLVPQRVYVTRVDTCWLPRAADTVYVSDTVPVLVPIERKEYATAEYRAVVEGWRPSLVEMEVYPRTQTVTQYRTRETIRKTRWGIGLQIGYGVCESRMTPYLGLGVQYNIVGW